MHCHTDQGSNDRFRDSIIKVPQLIDYAYELGNKGVAITDHESVSAHITAMQYLEKQKKKGKLPEDFKVIYGNEIYLLESEEETEDKMSQNEKISFGHFILLSLDKKGHDYMRELSSRAWIRGRVYRNSMRVPTYMADLREVIKEKGHLVVATACLGSTLNHIRQRGYGQAIEFMEEIIDIFGEGNVYLEMQPALSEDQIEYNKWLTLLSKDMELPLLIATDSHYLSKEHQKVHMAFLTSDSKGDSRGEKPEFYDSTHMYTVEQIYEDMNYLDEDTITKAITNTLDIYERAEIYTLEARTTIPKIELPPIPSWFYTPDEIFKKLEECEDFLGNILWLYDSKDPEDNYLFTLIFEGLCKTRKLYKGVFDEKLLHYLRRIDRECEVLRKISAKLEQPMSSYFVTMGFLVNEIIWERAQAIVGVSRGSALGFEINYLLNITQADPLIQPCDCPFWRFLHEDRPKLNWVSKVNFAKRCDILKYC